MSKSPNIFQQIHQIVKQIPYGKVTTYGAIARALSSRDSRLVGWALHGNRDPQIPCHRVVKKDGSLAKGFLFRDESGPISQRKKLKKEGVKFIGDRVDLKKFFWSSPTPKPLSKSSPPPHHKKKSGESKPN